MPNTVVRILLFVSSYFPLSVIFFLLLVRTAPTTATIVLCSGSTGLLGLGVYLRTIQKFTPFQVEATGVIRKDGEAMSYIVTYMLPFLAAPFGTPEEAIGLTIFFTMLAFLYINSDMLHINPMLNAFGYHIYEVELPDGAVRSIIASHRIKRGGKVHVVAASNDVYLEVPE